MEQALSTSTVSKRAVGSANMQAFSAAVRWFGSDVMTAVDHMGNRVSQLVEELQRGCANLSAASDTSMADIRRQISYVACVDITIAPSFISVTLRANNDGASASVEHVSL